MASFGILFAGCGPQPNPPDDGGDEFVFTADDVERFRELARRGTGALGVPHLELPDGAVDPNAPLLLDLSLVDTYDSIRKGPGDATEDLFRVTNAFVNVRDAPRVTGQPVDRLLQGSTMTVLDFPDAGWAHVKWGVNREGYVAQRYIAKIVSEEGLSAEKEKYAGQYFVNFGFLNVRKDPDSASEKLGELLGQAIVKPLSKDDVWARIPFEGREGYVATQYLTPFLPNFLVRQDAYELPILLYPLEQEGILDSMTRHIDALQQAGYTVTPLRELYTVLLKQEERDVRLSPRRVVIALSGITADNIKETSDALRASRVPATIFVQTSNVGKEGIDAAQLLTLVANGFDVQSAVHTGDDLRSLTNSQVELELRQSRQLIEQLTGKTVYAVLYPRGGVNDRIASKAGDAGYLLGVGRAEDTSFGRAQLLRLPSFMLKNSTSSAEVLGMVGE